MSIPTLQEIFTALKEMHQGVFSTTTNNTTYTLDLDATSPDGMAVALQARQIRRLFEMAQALAQLVNVNTATGAWLDRLAALKGLTRNDGETDDELRERILSSSTSGLATYDNMLSYLKDKLGSRVRLIVNDTDEEDEGTDDTAGTFYSADYNVDYLPPHSFAVFADSYLGSSYTDDFIAQTIWDCKPAGIEAHAHTFYYSYYSSYKNSANSRGTATDTGGGTHQISFYRMASVPLTLSVTVTSYDTVTWADEDALAAAVVESVTTAAAELLESDPFTLSGYACIAGIYSLGVYVASVELSDAASTSLVSVDTSSQTATSSITAFIYLGSATCTVS